MTDTAPPNKPKWSIWKKIGLGSLALVGGLVGVGLFILVVFGSDAPGVEGLTLKEARARIEASGLSTDVRGTPEDDARVCEQSPTAGERQFPGDPITVYVGDECDRIEREKLAEKRKEEAERAEEQRRKAAERAEEERRKAAERAKEQQGAARESPRDDLDDVTCADLGIDNTAAPGGEDLELNTEAVNAFSNELANNVTSGPENEKAEAASAALVMVCALAESPDVKPLEAALEMIRFLSDPEGSAPEASTGGCIIVIATGNKLCGEDAVAYCNGVSARDQDADSIRLCNDILAGRVP